MLTQKQNLLETLKQNGNPDRLVNQYRPFALIMSDPVYKFVRGNRVRGTTSKDVWGTGDDIIQHSSKLSAIILR